MRLAFSFAVTSALAAFVPATNGYAQSPAIGAWITTVTRETSVAQTHPGWTTNVAAISSDQITTGSIARTDASRHLPGPRVTGQGHALAGKASYYWQDQMTATGGRFDKHALTAAHRTLPFGTRVRVTRADNGKNVIVRINDRGPFKPGRIIDLSQRAAEVIGMTARGVASVKLEVLGK